MKITKILALALIAASVASCKKTDLTENQAAAAQTPVATTTASTTAASALSDWKTVSNWTSSGNQESGTQYSTTLGDEAITGEVAEKGLVLVFSKNQNNPELLPYSKGGVSWYYQVNKGSVTITTTAGKGASVANGQQFQYIILSAEQLSQLEAKGYSTDALMNMSYQKAVSIIK